LYGGSNFNGWKQSFGVGKYTSDDLIARGAKCEETSSMKVDGMCCKAKVYEYGDFNKRTNGFKVKLGAGEYDQDAMEWIRDPCSPRRQRWGSTGMHLLCFVSFT
jgi:hypothetical protein